MMSAPTVVLTAGAAQLRLAPDLGGRVTACELESPSGERVPVLHAYPEHHADLSQWAKGGIYPLIPYSGRLRDARLAHGGRDWPLTPHELGPHTLHGVAQRRPWSLERAGESRARMRYRHLPDGHWPWAFEAVLDVELGPRRLAVAITLSNMDSRTMPAGIGLHPYLVHAADDTVSFCAHAAWPFDSDYLALPVAAQASVRPHVIGPELFAQGEVTRFHSGWPGTLGIGRGAGESARVHLQCAGDLGQLVIHRPAAAPYVCIEPVSHVPDAFNLHARGIAGTGTRILSPGETMQGSLTIGLGPG